MSPDASATAAAGASARLGVDVRRFPWVRPLAGEYAFTYPNLAAFYAGDPRSPEAWRDVSERVRAQGRPRRELASALAAQQAGRGTPPQARAQASLFENPDAVAVVTGQQAGVFGGPLFTILKAISALQLAQRARETLGVPVVAVFWVDAEDHDWDEIAACTVLDAQLQPRTVTLPPPGRAGELPVASLRVDERVEATLEELKAALAETEFTPSLLEALRAAYRPGIGMAEAFARWLESLLGAHGLVVFDSSDAAVKPLLGQVFHREVTSPGHTAALAATAGEALAALGHAPQVAPHADGVSLFRMDGARKPIRRDGEQFVAGDVTFTAAALAADAAARPEHFSPNVLLRPIVQDTLFPTICYVAGPSELAYFGQLHEVYGHFGLPMPLIHPRGSATLVDSATTRFLSKYDVRFEDLQPQDEAALNRLLQSQLPPTVEAALTAAEIAAQRAMEGVIDAVSSVDPTLAGAARTTLGKMEHEIRALHGKVIQAAKRRDETLRRQFIRAQAQSFPAGQPQERSLAVIFFLNLYGPAMIERLLQELPVELGQHWVLSI